MPDSLTVQFLNNAWDDIKKKVDDGLAFGKQKTLPDIVTIVTAKLPDTTWQPDSTLPVGGGSVCVRRSATAAIVDYMYRLRLNYDNLQSPDLDVIETWAASARHFELSDVLKRLATMTTPRDYTAQDLNTVAPGGWGQLRCVVFTLAPGAIPVPDHPESVNWDGPIKINVKSPTADIQALVFRVGGGPYIRRPADLTLGWLPTTDDGVDLVLAEQLEFINATDNTIAAIHMVT